MASENPAATAQIIAFPYQRITRPIDQKYRPTEEFRAGVEFAFELMRATHAHLIDRRPRPV